MYYARVKIGGKLVRRTLHTDVYSKALLRQGDFLKEQRSKVPRSDSAPTTFAQARRRLTGIPARSAASRQGIPREACCTRSEPGIGIQASQRD
jgi:hypothetical protein